MQTRKSIPEFQSEHPDVSSPWVNIVLARSRETIACDSNRSIDMYAIFRMSLVCSHRVIEFSDHFDTRVRRPTLSVSVLALFF